MGIGRPARLSPNVHVDTRVLADNFVLPWVCRAPTPARNPRQHERKMASSALQNRVETQISKITDNRYASTSSQATLQKRVVFNRLLASLTASDDWERRNEAIVQLGIMFKEEAPDALTVEVLRPLRLPLQVLPRRRFHPARLDAAR